MCGIVGFVGRDEAAPILLDGLSRLEYRGYDSAGVAVYGAEEGMQVAKAKGRLQVLHDLVKGGATLHGTIGVGHTRWATHGAPSDVNSHPQVSENGRFAVVHNGIIENYAELREFLQSEGVQFVSDTDTEVAAQLLEYYYQGNLLEAVVRTLHTIRGAYALGILCADCPDRLIAARKDSPLILGFGDGAHYLASDVTALIKYTREVCWLEDGEIAELTADHLWVYDSYLRPVEKERRHVDWEISAAEKGGHGAARGRPQNHLSPDQRRPGGAGRLGAHRPGAGGDGPAVCHRLRLLLPCGRGGQVYLEVTLASEFRYCDPIVTEHTLALVISQSGETIDTLAAMREARRLGAKVVSIVNVVGSTIARESDTVLYTWAGPEIAVATTKAYSTQLAVIYLIGLYCADLLGTISRAEYDTILTELQRIPDKLEEILQDREDIQYFATLYFNRHSMFFIGRNLDYAVGLEGSLKLKEISYIHSEAYAAGELKHGTISLIEPGTLVVALAGCGPLFEKTVSNAVEVKSRGADLLGLTTRDKAAQLGRTADHVIAIPETHPVLLPSLEVVPMQLFAYYTALQRGCDIDKPRNLAKSVTVE